MIFSRFLISSTEYDDSNEMKTVFSKIGFGNSNPEIKLWLNSGKNKIADNCLEFSFSWLLNLVEIVRKIEDDAEYTNLSWSFRANNFA